MKTRHISKQEFLREVANYEANPDKFVFLGRRPVLIDFYASWCGPCKALAPILDELTEEYAGRVDIYKVNVDEEEELAAKFNVRSIPTLLFIPLKGQPQITSGVMPKSTLKEAIEKVLLVN